MTGRPWVSYACLTHQPDTCPLEHADGRRCANPAHTAYPDDLQPAGEQPTLEQPDLLGALQRSIDAAKTTPRYTPPTTCDAETVDPYPTSCDLDPGHDGDHENALGDTWPNEPTAAQVRATTTPAPGDAPAEVAASTGSELATPGAGPTSVGGAEEGEASRRRRRWRCPECNELVYRSEHVVGIDGRRAYACQVPRIEADQQDPAYCTPPSFTGGDLNVDPNATADETDPDEPRGNPHNHEWPAADPSTCACGAILNRKERTFTPAPEPPPLEATWDVLPTAKLDPDLPRDVIEFRDGAGTVLARAKVEADGTAALVAAEFAKGRPRETIDPDMLDVHDQVAAAVADRHPPTDWSARIDDQVREATKRLAAAHETELREQVAETLRSLGWTVHPPGDAPTRGLVHVDLTEHERRAVIHAHAILDPTVPGGAYDVAAELIRARLELAAR